MNIFDEYFAEMVEVEEWFNEEILIQDPKVLPSENQFFEIQNKLKKYW
jgi:hypothetical protein